jgi:serine/threonine protein kinase
MVDSELLLEDYRLGRTLGSTTTHLPTGKEYAVKIIKKSAFASHPGLQSKIRRQIALLKLLNHPHILKLNECLDSEHHLFDLLIRRGHFPRAEALNIESVGICEIMGYHQNGNVKSFTASNICIKMESAIVT